MWLEIIKCAGSEAGLSPQNLIKNLKAKSILSANERQHPQIKAKALYRVQCAAGAQTKHSCFFALTCKEALMQWAHGCAGTAICGQYAFCF